MKAVRMTRTGGPEVLEWAELADPQPGPGQLLVEVEAAGVNFIDIYRRSGLYPVPLPSVLGSEVAGRVLAVGPGVDDVAVGDRVASADAVGGYAERAIVPAARAVPVPEGVDARHAAAVLLQGMTAQYLTADTFPLAPGHRCVVHAAAGGTGRLLVQLARRAGAEVFATVGSAAKAEVARAAGAHHVVLTDQLTAEAGPDADWAAGIEAIAGSQAMDVVYDGIGQATFARGLDLLRPRGTMVTFGNASGPVDPVPPLTLAQHGSLFLTRPMLAHYTATTAELRGRGAAVLGLVGSGDLDVAIGAELPLASAAQAQTLLASRATTGKVLLIP